MTNLQTADVALPSGPQPGGSCTPEPSPPCFVMLLAWPGYGLDIYTPGFAGTSLDGGTAPASPLQTRNQKQKGRRVQFNAANTGCLAAMCPAVRTRGPTTLALCHQLRAQHRARSQALSSHRSPPGLGHRAPGLVSVHPPRPAVTNSRTVGRSYVPSSSRKCHKPGLHPGATGRAGHTHRRSGGIGASEKRRGWALPESSRGKQERETGKDARKRQGTGWWGERADKRWGPGRLDRAGGWAWGVQWGWPVPPFPD